MRPCYGAPLFLGFLRLPVVVVPLEPVPVGAAFDAADPPFVGKVPADRGGEAFFESGGLPPAQVPFNFRTIDGVAAIVARPVLDVGYQGSVFFRRGTPLLGHQVAEGVDDPDVFPFAFPAHVVPLSIGTPLEDQPDGGVVVLHVDPVPDVPSVPVHRQGFLVQDVKDDQGDEFFGELIGAVVVGTVGQGNRQAVGVVVRHHQVVAGCLGGRVGTAGVVGRGFRKESRGAQGTVDLVGADMVKQRILPVLPVVPGGFQQGKGPQDVGVDKLQGPGDGPVHVAFRGKMDHRIDIVFLEDPRQPVRVPDIGPFKKVSAASEARFHVREAFQVSRVGQ